MAATALRGRGTPWALARGSPPPLNSPPTSLPPRLDGPIWYLLRIGQLPSCEHHGGTSDDRTYGADALRWWLLADPAPVGTTDFSEQRLVAAYNRDQANNLGNLTSRTLTLARRARKRETAPAAGVGRDLLDTAAALPAQVDTALARYDFRSACAAIAGLAEAGNRFIELEAPWHLAKAAGTGDVAGAARFQAVIDTRLHTCRIAAGELEPFIPTGAARLTHQLDHAESKPTPAFPRLTP